MKQLGIYMILLSLATGCIFIVPEKKNKSGMVTEDSSHAFAPGSDSLRPLDSIRIVDSAKAVDSVKLLDSLRRDTSTVKKFFEGKVIDTKRATPQQVVEFAKTLIGVPYKYASTNPKIGFDCSGFITYVFNHFDIIVPRSSIDFTEVGTPIPVAQAKPGDLILFTGTDSTEHFVGHMGLVVDNNNSQLNFIHSTSGKQYGVTITPLNGYYKGRFMKIIRIFPQNR